MMIEPGTDGQEGGYFTTWLATLWLLGGTHSRRWLLVVVVLLMVTITTSRVGGHGRLDTHTAATQATWRVHGMRSGHRLVNLTIKGTSRADAGVGSFKRVAFREDTTGMHEGKTQSATLLKMMKNRRSHIGIKSSAPP